MKEIAEEHYATISSYLAVQCGNVRILNVTFINAILYVMVNGCPGRARPEYFKNWYSFYARFRRSRQVIVRQ